MVGAVGCVASTINNRHQRRESRTSQHGGDDHGGGGGHGYVRHGSRATISESRPPSSAPPNQPSLSAYTYATRASIAQPLPSHHVPPPGGGGGLTSTTQLPGEEQVELVPETLSLAEQVKFYVSLALGIVASLCVFALLFLIPLVVEPSISTLLADFDPSPAICVTVDYTSATGLSKCGLWASCREGCTSTPSQCHQIYVSYRRAGSKLRPRISNNTILDPHDWLDESRWDVSYTQLLVNAKGCGYPPRVKCEEFGDTYGLQGRTFSCFYSRTNPRLVVTDYNWEETAQPLLIALCLPTSLFAVSISILTLWYCPSCEERGKNKRPCRARYQSAPTQEATPRSNSRRSRPDGGAPPPPPPPLPPGAIVQQPRVKGAAAGAVGASGGHERSPSLATISSRDTTLSSVNSMDDGWQSPPSPPPRLNPRILNNHNNNNGGSNNKGTARARKL
ncbi:uncharacterized protein LOC110853628 [Folsomia candida]|uniref:uncharacterized protein LOC110853628 n=1 Tax=Folsomia candida TaxID=158441 RepID=UPI000B8FEAEE|nr:uncharacterized protein LOC110853628 [Folsomia candida]XP_021957613.1 uncharacterized protein LOC110853628 [Folsomia candida]